MSWIADQASDRTYDPVTGRELFFVSGGSDGSKSLEIRGEDFCLAFTASLVDEPITASERQRLNVPDAGIWRVYGSWTPTEHSIITEALSATRWRHGFSLRGEPYLVRFEAKGELYSAYPLRTSKRSPN